MENERQMLNRPCKDLLMCEPCSELLQSKSLFRSVSCPKCRKPIESFEKLYT